MLCYIHIPFCKRKCNYCSFVSFVGQETQAEKYIDLIIKEAKARQNELSETVHTVYIGGGTPSLLSPFLLKKLCDNIRRLFSISDVIEYTSEANPGTVSAEWLDTAVSIGINRLSVGMQAYQPELLHTLGRIHLFSDVDKTIRLARRAGIGNINLDLIFGIPGQSLDDWNETLDAALSLKPDHISAYGLIPEEGTPIFERINEGKLSLPDPETERIMYDRCIQILSDNGYMQYEISNFARKNRECIHNIGYWTQEPYIGLGISASSMSIVQKGQNGMICRRKTNPQSIDEYTQSVLAVSSGGADHGWETILPAESRFETIMLGLRMNKGIHEDEFYRLHGVSITEIFGKQLMYFEKQGLLQYVNGYWRMTRRGFDVQNSILVEFMTD